VICKNTVAIAVVNDFIFDIKPTSSVTHGAHNAHVMF